MTAISSRPVAHGTGMGAVAAPLVGYVTFVLAMFSGEYFGINLDSDRPGAHDHTIGEAFTESLGEYGLGLVGLALTVFVTARAWRGGPERLARTSLVLGILGGLTVIAFWSGWPLVFGAAATGLAIEAHRRVGSLGASGRVGLVTGTLAFLTATVICVTG